MSRNRSESPVKVTGLVRERSPLPQVDGTCLGRPGAPEPDPAPPVPEMPSFLRISEREIHDKYSDLIRLERDRIGSNLYTHPEADPVLDRYSNIHPWDENRVHLKVPEGVSDYINASPVTLFSTAEEPSKVKARHQDTYICMQGPKKETIDHTWHMLWHELSNHNVNEPGVIIMLSPLRGPDPNRPGQTMEKCFPYFPMDENSPPIIINESNSLGETFKAKVRFVSRDPTPAGTTIEIRKLSMSVEGEVDEKPIWHFLYPSWPDYGALEEKNVASIISLMDLSREKSAKNNPRVVHCSAGVGRTGTFIALEFLISELQSGAWEHWNKQEYADHDAIYDTVNQLREQRPTMVQAYEQYSFLYKVLKKMWEEKYCTSCTSGSHQHAAAAVNTKPESSPSSKSLDREKISKVNFSGSGKSMGYFPDGAGG